MRSILLAFLALCFALPVRAEFVWRDGPIEYLPGCDLNWSPPKCQDNGAGFYVSQVWDFPARLPRANIDVFYVRVYMQGIVSTARYAAPYFVLPPGAVPYNGSNARVECFYGERNGGDLMQFTDRPVLDDSVSGGSYWIGGCPQPPYPTVTFSNGATGYRLVRSCNYAGAAHDCTANWPMAGGASYEFWVPVYVTRAMDGYSDGNRMTWPVTVLESSLGQQWTYPSLALYASDPGTPPPPESSDLRATLQLGTGAAGRTVVEGRCINGGPNAASTVNCQFGGLPGTAIVSCQPAVPVGALGDGQIVTCSADFPNQAATVNASLQASTLSNDTNAANNVATLAIAPPAANADLQTTLQVATVADGRTQVTGRCENLGPAVAQQTTCTLTGLPAGTTPACTPAGPQALSAGQAIVCVAEFATPATALLVGLSAESSTPDPTPANDAREVEVPPLPPAALVFRHGFED